MLYPICPHFADIVYKNLVLPHHPEKGTKVELLSFGKWNEVDSKKIDNGALASIDYLKDLIEKIRESMNNV